MTNDNLRGLPVAWRIKWSPDFPESDELLSDGERLIACQALDNPPYIDALVLATDYAALQAEVEALRADAARYRWLREHFRFANDSLRELWFDASLEPNDSGVPADLDQELDAAIAAQQAEGGDRG